MFITLKTFFLEGALASLSTSLQWLKIEIPALFKTLTIWFKIVSSYSCSFSSCRRSYFKGCRSICIMWDLKGLGLIRANRDMLTMLTSQHLYIRTTFIGEYCLKRSLSEQTIITWHTWSCYWTEYMSWSISFSFDSKELNSLGGGHQIWKAFLCFCNSPFLSLWHISQDKYNLFFKINFWP